jgi:hypothetical protein
MKIEKGIPIPRETPRSAKKYKFLKSMEIGDSIVVETEGERNRLFSYAKCHQYKFISRKTGNKTLRIWLKEKPENEKNIVGNLGDIHPMFKEVK